MRDEFSRAFHDLATNWCNPHIHIKQEIVNAPVFASSVFVCKD